MYNKFIHTKRNIHILLLLRVKWGNDFVREIGAAAGTLSNFPSTAPVQRPRVFINMQEYVLSHVYTFLRAKRLSRCLQMQILVYEFRATVRGRTAVYTYIYIHTYIYSLFERRGGGTFGKYSDADSNIW